MPQSKKISMIQVEPASSPNLVYITVGDNPDVTQNTKCVDDQGSTSITYKARPYLVYCNEAQGKYIGYINPAGYVAMGYIEAYESTLKGNTVNLLEGAIAT